MNGTISFADISAANGNLSAQQENIDTAANPLADLTRSQAWDLDALGNFNSLVNNDGAPRRGPTIFKISHRCWLGEFEATTRAR